MELCVYVCFAGSINEEEEKKIWEYVKVTDGSMHNVSRWQSFCLIFLKQQQQQKHTTDNKATILIETTTLFFFQISFFLSFVE